MATAIDSISVNLFMPSLLHLASVKTAIQLYKSFDCETSKKAFAETQLGYSLAFHRHNRKNHQDNYNRAKEAISFIPVHLRGIVKIALNGLHNSTLEWHRRHTKIIDLKYAKKIIIWRSDGTIKETETAQQLVLDVNIDITVRFDFACKYCFEKTIQTLWAEMEDSDRAGCLQSSAKCMTRFWAGWLLDGCRVPWMQAIGQNLNPSETKVLFCPRFSSFFHFLKPEDRQKFFLTISYTTLEDMRLCLRIVAGEEKLQMLKEIVFIFLLHHLRWPMQSMFLDMAAKLSGYMSDYLLMILSSCIFNFYEKYTDFDYGKLFDDFWIRVPDGIKERAKRWKHLSGKIESRMNKQVKKRKVSD